MNKYLLMSAAAVLASTTVADATSHNPKGSKNGQTSFYTTNGTGAVFCNEWTVLWEGAEVANTDDASTYCGSSGLISYGMGLAGKVKGFGKVADLPSSIATEEGAPTYGSDFVVAWPLATGGAYVGFTNFGTQSIFEFSAGTIVLGQHPAKQRTAGQAQAKLIQFAKERGRVSK
jgi:hypothetical protein